MRRHDVPTPDPRVVSPPRPAGRALRGTPSVLLAVYAGLGLFIALVGWMFQDSLRLWWHAERIRAGQSVSASVVASGRDNVPGWGTYAALTLELERPGGGSERFRERFRVGLGSDREALDALTPGTRVTVYEDPVLGRVSEPLLAEHSVFPVLLAWSVAGGVGLLGLAAVFEQAASVRRVVWWPVVPAAVRPVAEDGAVVEVVVRYHYGGEEHGGSDRVPRTQWEAWMRASSGTTAEGAAILPVFVHPRDPGRWTRCALEWPAVRSDG